MISPLGSKPTNYSCKAVREQGEIIVPKLDCLFCTLERFLCQRIHFFYCVLRSVVPFQLVRLSVCPSICLCVCLSMCICLHLTAQRCAVLRTCLLLSPGHAACAVRNIKRILSEHRRGKKIYLSLTFPFSPSLFKLCHVLTVKNLN